MTQKEKVLSPHLQIYRWHFTMVMSILHRFSGVILWLSLCLIAILESCKALFTIELKGFILYFYTFVLICSLVAIIYHLYNGIRFLFFDISRRITVKSIARSGVTVLVLCACTFLYIVGYFLL